VLVGEDCECDFDGDGDDDGDLPSPPLVPSSRWLEEEELEDRFDATDLASPKSASFTVHSESRSRLEGLTSRWST
jgi:hypothetical protein